MKKNLVASFLFALVCNLSGCGVSLPNLKQEEMELVTDYAAEKLLEYDTNNVSRLVDEEVLLEKEAKDLERKKKQEEREKRRQELEKQIEEEREKLEKENQPSPDEAVPVEPIYSTDLRDFNEVLGWPSEVYLQYVGCEVMDVYPVTAATAVDGVNSTPGNSLCVLYFDIINTSDEAKEVSVSGINTFFQVQINNGGKFNALTTILPDDLNSYIGRVEPIGGTVPRVVLIKEYPSHNLESIESIIVIAKSGNDSASVKVK